MTCITSNGVEIVLPSKVVNVALTVTRVDVKREPCFVVTGLRRGRQLERGVSSRYELTHEPGVVYVRLAGC